MSRIQSPLIFVVAETKFLTDFWEGVEFGEEFIDGEIGDDEFTEFKSGCFGLTADGDHGVHVVVRFADVANIDFDSLTIEVADCLGAPGAAAFDVEDRFCFLSHKYNIRVIL